MKDIFDSFAGMQPVIFALETKKNMIKIVGEASVPIEIDHYIDYPDAVLLDIDASFVIKSNAMEQDLPNFPNEIEVLKSLNRIKNRKLDNYDKIYNKFLNSEMVESDNFIVGTIRECFFEMFVPYLIPAFLSIKTKAIDPKNSYDFFDKEKYIEYIV
jgi:hypothetical protein